MQKKVEKIGGQAIEIKDDINWAGISGIFKAIYHMVKKNEDIKFYFEGIFNSDDELYLVTPIWGGTITPTVKSFLKSIDINKINLISTSAGKTKLSDIEFKSIYNISISDKNEDEIIEEIFQKSIK